MFHIDNKSGVAVMPPVKEKLSDNPLFFTEGGNGTAPSWPGADWFNIVQSELLNLLREAGIEPDKSTTTQLYDALRRLSLTRENPFSDIKDDGDDAIQQALANLGLILDGESGISDSRISLAQPFLGAVPETQHEQNAKRIDALNAGAVGDGMTDDTAAFAILEAQTQYGVIDGLGRTYLVTAYPNTHRYINTTFLIAGKTVRGNDYFRGVTRGSNVILGDGAAPDLPANPTTSDGTANVVVGEDALKHGRDVRSSMAIGLRAMWTAVSGKYNMGVGLESLFYVDADGSTYGGTRNAMFGDNSGRFITVGYQNCGFGRNNSQGITTGNNNASFGTNALAGRGSLKFKDSLYIQNMTPLTVSFCTALGSNALYFGAGSNSTGAGSSTLANAKSDATNCTAVGGDALLSLGYKTSQDLMVQTDDGRSGTYTMTASEVTFTLPSHGLTTGWKVIVSLTSGVPYPDYQYYTINVVDANTFTVSEPMGIVTGGSFTLIAFSNLTPQASSTRNTAVGTGCMYNVFYGSENVAMGVNTMAQNTGGSWNTIIGDLALRYAQASSYNSALGYLALSTMQDGSQAISVTNSTGIGYNARVSGSNQIQLGNAAVTVYTQTAIQTRSDERDKTDKREIDGDLAVAFVRGLVPYFYKYDFRDDYIESYVEQTGVTENGEPILEPKVRFLERDGSKTRIRDHAGFLAQQVKELMDRLGIDFGMYQDHLIHGGCDVKTLAYEQSIPFMAKALDVAFVRQDAQDSLIAKQAETITSLETRLKQLEEKLGNN